MSGMKRHKIEDMYSSDLYMRGNQFIEEDSEWKTSILEPFVDTFAKHHAAKDITILDVGGGSGLIMKSVTARLRDLHGKRVRQLALDLSPGFLNLQKENNPLIDKTIKASIDNSGLADAEVDLVLLIDVLEHLFDTSSAYREIRRLSSFALIKVPLEDNFSMRLLEYLVAYRSKREKSVGHINFYNFKELYRELSINLGEVVEASYADVFSYMLNSAERRSKLTVPRKVYCHLASFCHKLSPSLTARVFNDFAVYLVKCRFS